MSEKKYSFIILHYNVIEETIACIASIKECMAGVKYSIVVVDNASPNGTGNELVERYRNDELVTILLNDENEGFARGNNKGISYARKIENPDFIVVLNNDTILLQKDFAQLIETEWEGSRFAVLGPKIMTPAGINQNPFPKKIETIKSVFWEYYRSCVGIVLAYMSLEKKWIDCKSLIKKILKREGCTGTEYKRKQECRQENVKLHGSFLIFSTVFFKHFQGFDPRTFLYVEEDILWNHLKNKGLLSVYNPLLEIAHNESVATKSTMKNQSKKRVFYWRERMKSLRILLCVLRGR